METAFAVDAFLEVLGKSRLLDAERLAQATRQFQLDEQPSAAQAAAILVKQGLLTRFQAEGLLKGRRQGFFIDCYKVLDILGTGGMGWLYIAEHEPTGDRVAIKVLSDLHANDAGMLTRLQVEARAGMRLNHPNIVRTLKLDSTEDFNYVVMEFVEGISLFELVEQQGRIPWPQACDFFLQVAAGLEHAHSHGLVHRDVKPANLLVERSGAVKLLDFGLALDAAGDDEFSLAMIFGHDCVGTEDFIAPEQVSDSSKVDGRADLYSLGCTFHYALTGVVPYPFPSNAEKLEAHRSPSIRPTKDIPADVPQAVRSVVERLMASQAADRFQTAGELAAALAPLARRRPVEFDFERLLRARADDARRRHARIRQQRSSAASARQSSTARSTSVTKPPKAAAPTRVKQDTRPERIASWLVDPFDTLGDDGPPVSGGRAEADAPQSAAVAGARLVPLDGGTPIPLKQTRVVIGRHADCAVQIPHPEVSNRHCELRFQGSWWKVTDLGSKNGVKVNGKPICDRLLFPGDRLTIAEIYHFKIEHEAAERNRGKRFWLLTLAGIAALIVGAAGLVWWLR